MPIDLHTHSTASDGTTEPGALVAEAVAAGLDVLAITDHDTYGGWERAERAALSSPITLVRGVEISCRTPGGVSMHLLGYLVDPAHEGLRDELESARDDRVPRAREIVRRLASDGYPIDWPGVLEQVGDGATVGRPHVADALVAAGAVRDRGQAFAELLNDASPYYVAHYTIDPVRAVRLVREAGGVPVIAHPGASRRGEVVGDDVLGELASAGLAGLEVDHPDHDDDTRSRLRGLAGDLGLLATGSSDYHGTGKPNRLGQDTTDPQVLARLLAQATGPVRPVGGPPER